MIIVAKKNGRLGNRLVLFANMIAHGIEHGHTVVNPCFEDYAGMFETTRDDPLCRYPPLRHPAPGGARTRHLLYRAVLFVSTRLERYDIRSGPGFGLAAITFEQVCDMSRPEFVELADRKKVVFTRGYTFRDIAAVEKHGDAIRRHFVPIKEHRDAVASFISRAREGCDVLVGVHIRRTDYERYADGRYFFDFADYARYMDSVEGFFPGRSVKFLVCSDEPVPEEVLGGSRIVRGPGPDILDLYSLAQCDLLLGPPSSFTLWASFYGGVSTIHLHGADASVELEDAFVVTGNFNPTGRSWREPEKFLNIWRP